jgi:hypothetical protein
MVMKREAFGIYLLRAARVVIALMLYLFEWCEGKLFCGGSGV